MGLKIGGRIYTYLLAKWDLGLEVGGQAVKRGDDAAYSTYTRDRSLGSLASSTALFYLFFFIHLHFLLLALIRPEPADRKSVV